jgi:hypothetical protein
MIPDYCKIFMLLSLALTLQSVHAEEIRLIVRGDDLGMTQGSIAGFEKAFKEGVLTCASIQVPAPWFEAAADLAKKHRQWCFGVHLTLIGEWRGYRWRPVLPWDQLTSIVDPRRGRQTCQLQGYTVTWIITGKNEIKRIYVNNKEFNAISRILDADIESVSTRRIEL